MAQWSALKLVIADLNSHEKPYEEFTAFMVFVLLCLKGRDGLPLDGSLLSDAVQTAFLEVEASGKIPFSSNQLGND